MTGTRTPAARLAVPGLLLALVVTGSLPAWAGAASARPADPATACAVDAAAGDVTEPVRC